MENDEEEAAVLSSEENAETSGKGGGWGVGGRCVEQVRSYICRSSLELGGLVWGTITKGTQGPSLRESRKKGQSGLTRG